MSSGGTPAVRARILDFLRSDHFLAHTAGNTSPLPDAVGRAPASRAERPCRKHRKRRLTRTLFGSTLANTISYSAFHWAEFARYKAGGVEVCHSVLERCRVNHASQFFTAVPKPGAAARLFCFPHAGGGPVAFFNWAEGLGPQIECVALQYAGRGQRGGEAPHFSVTGLVEEIAGEFGPWQDKPFAFYGHSFGGIVAFELARKLRQNGSAGPLHLFAGAVRAPHVELPFPPIHHLPDKDFVERVHARYGGIPEAIARDREILDLFLPAMRADFTAFETYCCQTDTPLDVPITVFGGADDLAVKLEALNAWTVHTRGGFDRKVLPGGHFFPPASLKDVLHAIQLRMSAHQSAENSTLAG